MASKRWSGLNTFTVHEAQNASLGQGGSAFITGTTAVVCRDGKTIVAITFLENTQFNSSDGLVAEDSTRWFNSESNATNTVTANDDNTDNEVFPAGVTIFGRWTEVRLASGKCVVYVA